MTKRKGQLIFVLLCLSFLVLTFANAGPEFWYFIKGTTALLVSLWHQYILSPDYDNFISLAAVILPLNILIFSIFPVTARNS